MSKEQLDLNNVKASARLAGYEINDTEASAIIQHIQSNQNVARCGSIHAYIVFAARVLRERL